MPRRQFIDKKNAQTFRLLHRSQADPRANDSDAPQMVFSEVVAANVKDVDEPASSSRMSQYSAATGHSKIKSRRDLESEYGSKVRQNEGEAANYGIFYDDTNYDYMQHMRDLGSGEGTAYFLEAPTEKKKGKGKQKMDLADLLRDSTLDDHRSNADFSVASNISSVSDVFGEDMAPSEFVRKQTYQDQQNIPDAIAGFQPDMDPRLREVLEALDDEAYVDDEDDIFNELAEDGYEIDQREFDSTDYDNQDAMSRFLNEEEDEGWETDDTIKASSPAPRTKAQLPTEVGELPEPDEAPVATDAVDMAYLEEFKKFKNDVKAGKVPPKAATPSAAESSIMTGASALTAGGRKKKRKGAMTSTSGYSMSSSALHRTEGLTLLDRRFDKIEESYAEDSYDMPDDASVVSGMSKMSGLSKMSGASGWSASDGGVPLLRSDFDSIMDGFLDSHHVSGKRTVKKFKEQSGMEQLDEVRKGLGAARVGANTRNSVLRS